MSLQYSILKMCDLPAPIIPLTTVILAEYLGIEHLTNAHGMVSLGKGIASLISAPVAGKCSYRGSHRG